MLQKFASREVTRRNYTLAISSFRASSSVQQAQDVAIGIVEKAKREPRFSPDFSDRFSSRHNSLFSFCFQCSFSIIHIARYSRILERSSDHTPLFIGTERRRSYSSAVAEESSNQNGAAEEATDQASPSADAQSNAFRKYLKVIQVCEVLEALPWGQDTAKHLEDLDVSFTSDMVVKVIRAASSPTSSLGFLNWLAFKGYDLDVSTYRTMLDILGKAGAINDMKHLADEMRNRALVLDGGLYDRLIHWCVCHGDAIGASYFLEKMKEEGITMSASTYTSTIALHVREGKFEDAVTLYLQMVDEAVFPSSDTFTLLIRCLLEAGKLDLAQKIFTSFPSLKVKPSSSMYAYLMAAHAEVSDLCMLKSLGKEMRNCYGRPGEVFFVALNSLQKVGKVDEADAFAKEVWPELCLEERRRQAQDNRSASTLDETNENDTQNDFEYLACADRKVRVSLSDTVSLLETEGFSVLEQLKLEWTADSIYKVLRQLSSSDWAWELFKWLKTIPGFVHDRKNEVFMLRILVKGLKFSAFKELLSDLQSNRDGLSLEIFNILIRDCGLAKNARLAMWVYSRIKESNLQADEETFTSLVHAFARGRNPDKASDLCSVMQDVGIKPDVETYTAVIHSLGLSGRADDAWSVYQRMLAVGLKPNVNTYTALLNMMKMVGDTAFGIKIFKDMNDSGVSPTEATQGIMATIWETAGNSAEAQNLDTQRKFLSSKKREDSLHHIYEVLLEGLVEQERSPSLACVIR